jgi:hypothetical protein
LHLLASRFPTNEEDTATNNNTQGNNDDVIHRPAFGLHQELEAKAPIVALEWLSERSLVFLTLTNELTVVDTALMILLRGWQSSSSGAAKFGSHYVYQFPKQRPM